MKSAFFFSVPLVFLVYNEFMLSFSCRLFFRVSSSCKIREVKLAVAVSLMPLEGLGVEAPDCGVPDRGTPFIGAFCFLSVSLSFASCNVGPMASRFGSSVAFLFLLPLAFLRACVKPRVLKSSSRSSTCVLSFSVLGKMGTMSRSS